MDDIEQKYSNTTVFIVIAFLALFIVLPPLTRVLYAEDEQSLDTDTADSEEIVDNTSFNGTLTCIKEFPKTNLSISSLSTYVDGQAESNVITFNNPNNLLDSQLQDETEKSEYLDFSQTLEVFQGLDSTYLSVQNGVTTATLNQQLLDSLTDNENISVHFQDSLTLQNYYETQGYTCTSEE